MQHLQAVIESINRACQLLDLAGPGGRSAYPCWQQARIHLAAARAEVAKSIEARQAGGPTPPDFRSVRPRPVGPVPSRDF